MKMKLEHKLVKWVSLTLGTLILLLVGYKILWLGFMPPGNQLIFVLGTVVLLGFCAFELPSMMQRTDEASERLDRLLQKIDDARKPKD